MTTDLIQKVLLVDDRKENLVALSEILQADERALFSADSGNQALALALEHDFAVILLDVMMPVMDGFEVGAIDYMFKPLDPNIVRSKVKVFCELKKLEKEREQLLKHLEKNNKITMNAADWNPLPTTTAQGMTW